MILQGKGHELDISHKKLSSSWHCNSKIKYIYHNKYITLVCCLPTEDGLHDLYI